MSKIEVLRGPRIEDQPPGGGDRLEDQRDRSQPLLRKTKTDVKKSKDFMMKSLRDSRNSPHSKENISTALENKEIEKRNRRSPVIIKAYESMDNHHSHVRLLGG